MPTNPLVADALIDFLLSDVLDAVGLTALPYFAEHDRQTFDLWLDTCRGLARESLYPAYRPMDAEPPRLVDGRVVVHPAMRPLWRALAEAGVITAPRPYDVGGQQLPLTVATMANTYLMAANLSAYGYAGLTAGAGHLIEAFGDDALRKTFMEPMYAGRFTGTMALTEPQAGSSLADITTQAEPTPAGHYRLRGAKIFISGGDHDVAENVVHLALARIVGAPAGTRGISLFAVPRLRPEGDGWVPNDVHVTGVIHKIGWRGLPSVALAFGERDDCHGWLVGAPHQGLRAMFQMMNEARLMVGANGVATAMVAYHEAVDYARERRQGRPLGVRDAASPPVPLVEHADVRRMLLRQKAIVEGALCLLGVTARYADLAGHAVEDGVRERARLLLDLLTPIAKTFPAEWGFEANTLAVQVFGGYGYSSEYPVEAWWRDQKLNSIHEGTSGIQALDLVGRKIVQGGGQALLLLREEIEADLARAATAGVPASVCDAVRAGLGRIGETSLRVLGRLQGGETEAVMAHATHYLQAMAILVIGWMWLKMWIAASCRTDALGKGLVAAARYWIVTELPRIDAMATLVDEADSTYAALDPDTL